MNDRIHLVNRDDSNCRIPINSTVSQLLNAFDNSAESKRLKSMSNRLDAVQRVMANRVEYQHNRKVVTDDKGVVKSLNAPIDISFGSDEHSTYFADERKKDQLTGLRTVRWEMNDDWWNAAYYHSYGGKKLTGKAKSWYDKIKENNCKEMSPSDGKSISTDTKKKAPHFDESWQNILNQAIIKKGTSVIEDTESERREEIENGEKLVREKRDNRQKEKIKSNGGSFLGKAFFSEYPNDPWETTESEAKEQGAEWIPY